MKRKESKIKHSLLVIYSLWTAFWFISTFLLLYPLMFIFLQKLSWRRYTHRLVRFWGQLFFLFAGMRIQVKHHYKPDRKKVYVFCANHFSYLDIPLMVVIIKNYFSFIGKTEIKKVPLFGYLYARLNILVNRNDRMSRATSLGRSIKALQAKRSIIIFPEGGIVSKEFPIMGRPLMDGAFVMAVQQQVPVVPISVFNNHLLLNDHNFLLRPGVIKVEIHPPVETLGLTNEDVPVLRERVFEMIQNPILAHYGIDAPQ